MWVFCCPAKCSSIYGNPVKNAVTFVATTPVLLLLFFTGVIAMARHLIKADVTIKSIKSKKTIFRVNDGDGLLTNIAVIIQY